MLAMSRLCFSKGVGFTVGHVAFAAEYLKVEVKDFIQLAVPVVDQTGGHHHQRPLEFAPADEFAQDERRFNRLAEADFISD